jgi:hypothetical protein
LVFVAEYLLRMDFSIARMKAATSIADAVFERLDSWNHGHAYFHSLGRLPLAIFFSKFTGRALLKLHYSV